MDGYVKLWRKVVENGWLKNPELWTFWCYCLCKASHKEHTMMIGFQQIVLQPGDFPFGRRKAAKDLKMSEQTIRTCLKNLKNMKNLTIKTTHHYSIISITNWGIYQGLENETNPQTNPRLTHTQPTPNHKQEGKKGRREEKKKNVYLEFVFLTTEEHQKLLDSFGQNKTDEMIKRLNGYIGSKGDKYKSHYYTILSWHEKDLKEQKSNSDNYSFLDRML